MGQNGSVNGSNYPNQRPQDELPPSTAEMMAAYTGARQQEEVEDEGALAWTYLLVIGVIFVGLLFLAWSCQGDDELVGGLSENSLTETTFGAAVTTQNTVVNTQAADSTATPDTATLDVAGVEGLQTQVDSLLENTKLVFEPNETAIASGESVIASVAELVANQNVNVKVEGYTDSVGDEADNLALSQERADAVKDKLVAQGIAASRITTEGFGESQAVQENPTDAQKEADRRIEIQLELAG